MADILATPKGRTVTLSDGNEYQLPPMNLNTLANIEVTMGFGLAALAEKMETGTMTTMRLLIYALLKESHPKLTLEKVGKLVTLKEMGELSEMIGSIMTFA